MNEINETMYLRIVIAKTQTRFIFWNHFRDKPAMFCTKFATPPPPSFFRIHGAPRAQTLALKKIPMSVLEQQLGYTN